MWKTSWVIYSSLGSVPSDGSALQVIPKILKRLIKLQKVLLRISWTSVLKFSNLSIQITWNGLEGPITLSRDHHDVSGADSPYRETASVRDGSMICADMSVQNFVGTAIRGATWVALHNGGGTGWGEVINGGFGVVLTGTKG